MAKNKIGPCCDRGQKVTTLNVWWLRLLIGLVRLLDHLVERHFTGLLGLRRGWAFRFGRFALGSTGNKQNAADQSEENAFHRMSWSVARAAKAINLDLTGRAANQVMVV